MPRKAIVEKITAAKERHRRLPMKQPKLSMGALPDKRKRKPRPAPEPKIYVDRAVIENGELTDVTVPVAPMTHKQYDQETRTPSKHLGYAAFLRSRSLNSLKLALSRDGSAKATRFLKALMDVKNIDVDIAVLAEKHGIGFNELMAVWRSDKLSEAMANIIERTPTVALHTAEDAESSTVCCPRCDGAGLMKVQKGDEEFAWVQCTSCVGTGAVRKVGDSSARRYVFEATGIIKAGVGVNVNITNASNVESVIDEIERATSIPVTSEVIEN